MIEQVANSVKMQNMLQKHAKEMITVLHQENLHFSIICDTSLIRFSPPLSRQMKERLGKIAAFILSGYSFQSLEINENYFEFEAGLVMQNGEDLGTTLEIPYHSVMQIVVQDENENQSIMVYCNPFEFTPTPEVEDSMLAILSNNSHILYKDKSEK